MYQGWLTKASAGRVGRGCRRFIVAENSFHIEKQAIEKYTVMLYASIVFWRRPWDLTPGDVPLVVKIA
jgi:hypothetical protein